MRPDIARILGVSSVKNERAICGTVSVEGREFRYLEVEAQTAFVKTFDKVTSVVVPMIPKNGGVMIDRCELTAPDGRKFESLSYRGNFEDWREQVQRGADHYGLLTGQVEPDKVLALSNGERFPLQDCRVRFY